MKETISLEITPKDLEHIMSSLNTSACGLHDKIVDKKGNVVPEGYFYKEWQDIHQLWCKCYDLKAQHETIEVWK